MPERTARPMLGTWIRYAQAFGAAISAFITQPPPSPLIIARRRKFTESDWPMSRLAPSLPPDGRGGRIVAQRDGASAAIRYRASRRANILPTAPGVRLCLTSPGLPSVILSTSDT